MRFARLYLRAFGAFSDREIDLAPLGANDLHLMFGPNEAGKSTILRAVTGFLFGIPERTGDAFRHDYNALRVGATLQFSDGTRRSLLRRKARKHTLFALDATTGAEDTAQPVPEQQLTDLLGGLDLNTYQHLFGLDLKHLIDGGEELLRGEGEVGRSLFQAAAGIAGLRTSIGGLDAEAEAIFKPRGSVGRLNRALREFDEQRRAVRDATVRASDWDQAASALRDAEAAWRTVRATQQERRAAQLRLTRIRANLPRLAERAAIRVERASLPPAPELPADTSDRRVRASESLRLATEQQRAATARLQQCEAQAAALIVRPQLLEHASAIEQTYHALDEYQTARAAMGTDAAERETQSRRVRQLLAAIDAADVEDTAAADLLPPETLSARVRQLAEEQVKLTDRIEQLASQAVARRAALQERMARLNALPESKVAADAERQLARVANLADLDARRQALAAECAARQDLLWQNAVALGYASVEELLRLPLPLAATVEQFADEFAALARERHALAESTAALQRDRAALDRDERLRAAHGAVMTPAEVSAARASRNLAWQGLRNVCVDAAAPPPAATAKLLADAVEGAIEMADARADQLYADAGRVAEIESIRRRLDELDRALAAHAVQRDALAASELGLQARWNSVVAPLARADLSPAAAREWLVQQRQFSERHGEFTRLRAELERIETSCAQATAALDRILHACGAPGVAATETPAEALERLRYAVSEALRLAAERTALAQHCESIAAECRESDVQLQRLIDERAARQTDWAAAMHRLRLPAEALPIEARTRLDQLARLAAAQTDAAAAATQTARRQALITSYERRVADLARACDEPNDLAPDQLAERLYAALAATRTAEATRQRLVADRERERQVRVEVEATIIEAEQAIATLLRLAGCAAIDDLPKVEAAALRQAQLAARERDIERQLVQDNACTIAEVIAEAAELTVDEIARQLDVLQQEIEVLDRELELAQDALFRARAARDAIDGGGSAADAAQALASIGARIAQEVRCYARVRLASAVLDRVMQSYRERHQGPLLRRAAEVFARITLGSFADLAIDHDDDRQVLVGIRQSGKRVTVAGMSQGTRDQLYLALRLAAIERHIAERGPFPVIVDDLLVQFDDERALATLALLAELGTRTQVLCFTHHQHLLELIAGSALATRCAAHRL